MRRLRVGVSGGLGLRGIALIPRNPLQSYLTDAGDGDRPWQDSDVMPWEEEGDGNGE